MAERDAVLVVRLTGESVSPDSVSLSALTRLFGSLDRAVASLLPVLSEGESEVEEDDERRGGALSLVGVRKGSAAYYLGPLRLKFRPQVLDACLATGTAVKNHDFSNLPNPAIENLRQARDVLRQFRWNARLVVRAEKPLSALMTPETSIPEHPRMRGQTILYGMVERVGGTRPKVWLRLGNGKRLPCKTTQDIARRLGARLYAWVGLSGTAVWDTKDLSLLEFRVEAITEYVDTPVSDAFWELAEVAGSCFDGVDPVRFVRELRDGDDR